MVDKQEEDRVRRSVIVAIRARWKFIETERNEAYYRTVAPLLYPGSTSTTTGSTTTARLLHQRSSPATLGSTTVAPILHFRSTPLRRGSIPATHE